MQIKKSFMTLTIMTLLLISITSCSLKPITSRFVEDIEKNQKPTDDELMQLGINNNDVSKCNDIEFSLKKEECLIKVAKQEKNPTICYFIDNIELRENCFIWVK